MTVPFLIVRSPDDGDTALETPEAARAFMQEIMEHWTWVARIDSGAHQHLSSLVTSVTAYIGSGSHQSQADQAFGYHRLPVPGGSLETLVDKTAINDQKAAIALLSIITRYRAFDASDITSLKALAALISFDQKLTPQSIEASQASFKRAVTGFQRQEAAARSRSSALENKLAEAERRSEIAIKIARRFIIRRSRQHRDIDAETVEAAVADLKDTKALYMEHMALRAPVEYWKSKAVSHKTASKTMRTLLLTYAGVGTVLLLLALYFLFTQSIDVASEGKPASVLLILATMGVVLTTIAFWAGRILTRLYLSEVHLSIDAGERATMVETYLALTSVNQASAEDRAIVLASLFRPTADGIVKDDGAPELSPASILSKVVGP